MTQRTLAESLAAYADSDYYPFHMPGHKRRLTETLPDFPEALQRAARLDITEIDGFDNLHDPEGILKDAEEKAAALRPADRTRALSDGEGVQASGICNRLSEGNQGILYEVK